MAPKPGTGWLSHGRAPVNAGFQATLARLTESEPGDRTMATTAGTCRYVPATHLQQWPGNPRRTIDPAALRELAANLLDQGVLQNLLVRPLPDDPTRFE